MDFFTGVQSSGMIESGSIIVLPLRAPLDVETAGYSFLGTSGVALFVLRGAPSAWTGVRLVGCHGGALPPDVEAGDHFRFVTPANFIVAKEELLALGQQWASTLPGSIGKRNRSTLEDEGGVQASTATLAATGGASAQGERNTYLLYDPEGHAHPTRVKSDLVVREQDLSVVFRVTATDRWQFVMGREFVLQVRQYRDVIVEQHATRAVDRLPGFSTCGLYDRISSLRLCRDLKLLEMLLKGHFGGSEVGAIGLQNFLGDGLRLPTGSEPCLRNNDLMVTALKNLELVLMVYFSAEFKGVTEAIIESLEGVDRPLELAPAGYLGRTVETALTKYFRRLRTNGSTEHLAGPQQCSDALKDVFRQLLLDTDTQPKLSEAVQRYNLHTLRERAVMTTVTPPSGKPAGIENPKACQHHVAGQLKIVNLKTGACHACNRKDCPKDHPTVSKFTTARLASIVDTFTEPLLGQCRLALRNKK